MMLRVDLEGERGEREISSNRVLAHNKFSYLIIPGLIYSMKVTTFNNRFVLKIFEG